MKRQLACSWFPVVGLVCLLLAWIALPASVSSEEKRQAASVTTPDIQSAGLTATGPDAYEPDNTWLTSKVIILNDQEPHPELPSYKPIQTHNFHMAGDEDWVKFFILKEEIYKISVDSPGDKCDVVIGIYDIDGQTLIKEVDDTFAGEKEYAEWECKANGVYYARIRQFYPEVFGEGTAYQLSLTQPYMTFKGFIFGTVSPAVEARLSTGYRSVLAVDGEFFMAHEAGDFTLQVVADGCASSSIPITVLEIVEITVDVVLECSGALKVTIAPQSAIDAGARWRVDWGNWRESEEEVSGLAVGEHTIEFKSLTGWDAPADQAVNIVSGQTAEVSGFYWKGGVCLAVAGDLSISVPCAEYLGNRYGFTLNFYSNPDDPSGLYWKMDGSTLTGGTGSDCIPIGSDLSMPMPCAAYNGTQYGFALRFYSNPYDPSGLYWKMDLSTLSVK